MTRETPQSDAPLSRDQLIRAAADGELSPQQQQALERLRAEDSLIEARIETERALRESVARVMGKAAAPAGLADRIRGALAEETAGEPISFAGRAQGMGQPAPRSWQRPWWLGVAAGFLLAAGLMILVSPWSTQPGHVAQLSGSGAFSTTTLVSFIEKQHDDCANLGAVFERAIPYRTRAEAERAAIELLEVLPDVFDLPVGPLADRGYAFAGLGQCRIPGEGASAHLMYTSEDESVEPISLWIQRDTGEWHDQIASPGACYDVSICQERGTSLSVWRDAGLVYFLYMTDQDLESGARDAFSAPEHAGTI